VTSCREKGFSLRHRVGYGAYHPPVLRVTGAISRRKLKRAGHQNDHSRPSSQEIKNAWIYALTSTYVISATESVKWNPESLHVFTAQEQVYLAVQLIFVLQVFAIQGQIVKKPRSIAVVHEISITQIHRKIYCVDTGSDFKACCYVGKITS